MDRGREMPATRLVEEGMDEPTDLAPWSYRDADAALRARRSELILARRGELTEVDGALKQVYARRVARSAAGVAAIVGAATLPVVALTAQHGMTAFLLGTVPLVGLVYVIARAVARAGLVPGLARSLREGPDVYADVERLERLDGQALTAEAVDRLEARSVALPMIGISLVSPLLIHFVFFVAALAPMGGHYPDDFDSWIKMSLVLVAHAHVVLAVMCWRFARRLARLPVAQLGQAPSGWSAWGVAVAAAALPGALLVMIPPAIVAVTGVLFVPALFGAMRRRVARERALLGG